MTYCYGCSARSPSSNRLTKASLRDNPLQFRKASSALTIVTLASMGLASNSNGSIPPFHCSGAQANSLRIREVSVVARHCSSQPRSWSANARRALLANVAGLHQRLASESQCLQMDLRRGNEKRAPVQRGFAFPRYAVPSDHAPNPRVQNHPAESGELTWQMVNGLHRIRLVRYHLVTYLNR